MQELTNCEKNKSMENPVRNEHQNKNSTDETAANEQSLEVMVNKLMEDHSNQTNGEVGNEEDTGKSLTIAFKSSSFFSSAYGKVFIPPVPVIQVIHLINCKRKPSDN